MTAGWMSFCMTVSEGPLRSNIFAVYANLTIGCNQHVHAVKTADGVVAIGMISATIFFDSIYGVAVSPTR